jgi:hypothetical protein
MLFRRSCVLTGCMLLALAAAPAAEAAKQPRLTSLRGVPKAVQVGGHFRVIWLRSGDVKIYSCAAADSTCVVPSA